MVRWLEPSHHHAIRISHVRTTDHGTDLLPNHVSNGCTIGTHLPHSAARVRRSHNHMPAQRRRIIRLSVPKWLRSDLGQRILLCFGSVAATYSTARDNGAVVATRDRKPGDANTDDARTDDVLANGGSPDIHADGSGSVSVWIVQL
jgi:hypothetical protein